MKFRKIKKAISCEKNLLTSQKSFFDSFFIWKTDWLSKQGSYQTKENKKFFYIKNTNINFAGNSILICCGGGGIFVKEFIECGASVTLTDISQKALNYAKQTVKGNFEIDLQNAESLTYKDSSFDWGFVCNGLHHLEKPLIGLYELLRVSKKGIILIESQDSLLIRLACYFRLSEIYEKSGNYVYRFSKREIEKTFKSYGNIDEYLINSKWIFNTVPKNKLLQIAFKGAIRFLNIFYKNYGNFLLVVAKKPVNS